MQKQDQNSQALGSCLCERAKHIFKSILWLRNPSSSTHQGLSGAGAVQLLRGALGSRLPLTLSDFGALENSFQSTEGNAQHLWFIEAAHGEAEQRLGATASSTCSSAAIQKLEGRVLSLCSRAEEPGEPAACCQLFSLTWFSREQSQERSKDRTPAR